MKARSHAAPGLRHARVRRCVAGALDRRGGKKDRVAAPVAGLSPADLAGIRQSLAAGRRPKVVFTARAGQMAGNAGQVIEMTDPAQSDEWIVVRFGQDELPFSPGDLAIGRRGTAVAAATLTTTATAPTRNAPRRVVAREETPVPARRTTAPAAPPPPAAVAIPVVPARAPKQPKPPKVPAPLVVTLTYADQRWTVAANHGSKTLAKPYGITPTEALRMVALINVPGVHDAVASIVAAERLAAEDRAQRLRAELAEIESRLAELATRS
jgi:hypothetical protein